MDILKPARIVGFLGIYGLALTGSLWAQANENQTQQSQANQGYETVPGSYTGINQTPWFSHPTVRQQLKLNDDQFQQLHQNYRQAWSRYDRGLNQLDNNLTREQRMERLHRLNSGFYNDFSKSANSVLTDPAARERYNQLQWKYRGYGAFTDPEIQRQLNISEAQRQDILQTNYKWNHRMASWNRDYVADPDAVLKKFNESRGEFQEGMRTFLTPEQQRTWSDMAGKPYDFPAEVYFQTGTSTTTAKPVTAVP